MSTEKLTTVIEITAGGGTIDLNDYAGTQLFVFVTTGAVSLTSNLTIQDTGTNVEGQVWEILWKPNLDLNGNTLTIFGQAISAVQASKRGAMTVTYSDGGLSLESFVDNTETEWIPTGALVDEAVTTAKIDDDAVTTAKIDDGAVTPVKASAGLAYGHIAIPISFETGFLGANRIYFPFACTLFFVSAQVQDTIEATDDASIAISTLSGAVTGSPLTILAGTPNGNGATAALSGANAAVTADSYVTLTTTKVTPGGQALVTLAYNRT